MKRPTLKSLQQRIAQLEQREQSWMQDVERAVTDGISENMANRAWEEARRWRGLVDSLVAALEGERKNNAALWLRVLEAEKKASRKVGE